MLTRAYSVFDVKSVDDEARTIEGLATTPETDRMGDIVEPKGATFKLPLPLLYQHDSRQPIGQVLSAKVTNAGIAIKAQIAKGLDIPRIDEAWSLIKSGLVRGLSIGFKALETADIEDTYGVRFVRWEWLELSAVTVPANASASIQTIKSLDAEALALSGLRGSVSRPSAGVPAEPRTTVRLFSRGTMKKSYAQQIKETEATIATKSAERDALIDKSIEDGSTFDASQKETYATLEQEIKDLAEHVGILRDAEKRNLEQAVEVKAPENLTRRPASAAPGPVRVEVNSRLKDGLGFAAAVRCKAYAYVQMTQGNFVNALDVAKQWYPDESGVHQYLAMTQKTAVAGGTTSDSNWATSLLEPNQILVNDFLEYLRPRTLIGQIPGLRRVPFNVTFQSQTSAASASWVGQGKAKPLTKFNTATTSLAFTKIAAISVITDELARFSRPGAEGLVRDELARSVIERMDLDFVDPAKAVSSGVNPASITNGVTPISGPAGTSAANALTDIQNLVIPFVENKYDVGGLVVLMPHSLAFGLSLMLNASGFRSFPDININGGSIGGLPVITSQYMASLDTYGNMVIVLHAPSIAIADDGNVAIDVSREASLEMSDAPAQDATNGTGASMVSMFQTNSVAIRAEREINWKKLRATAVTWMDDVNWGAVGSPR